MVFHRAKTMVTVQYLRFSEPRSATLDAVSNVAPGREYGVLPPGYRLPDQTRVGRVRLQVGDLDRSVGYYRDVLGFRTIEAHGRCELAPQGDDHVIAELHEFHGARHVPPGGLLGLYHFAVLLPDRAALGRLVRYLLKAGMQFGSADHAVSESIYLWDPDGLGIEIYADRPRASWQTRGRELMMGTDLLDLQSLVALADGDWTGIPMGTTMGHVHLSVGDLEWSREFYHVGLGLDAVVWSYPGALFLSAGGYHHHLATNTWAVGSPPAGENDAKLLEWELVLPSESDVAAATDSLRTAGYGASEDGTDRVIVDPWRIQLRLRGNR
jgi:catechol 2,3-dioxygenase